jgi:hypothetical protein
MVEFLEDPRCPISYDAVFREIYARKKEENIRYTFAFCPWCATKLPESLRVDFFDILRSEYGLDLALGDIKDSPELIPPEFKTDEWWKKRGL